jgi:polyisoprenoid-binding protein YceI
MQPFRSFIPPLAVMLMAASGGASAHSVLIDRSEIKFTSKQLGASVAGKFRKWKANVDFRPKDLKRSRAELEIELASIDLASEESEAELRRAAWFDTARYPVARFASSGMKALGADRYEIAGNLSIKGTTREVLIPVAIKKDASGNNVAEGQFTLNRLDFRIGDGLWADTDTFANEVAIRIRMVLPSLG